MKNLDLSEPKVIPVPNVNRDGNDTFGFTIANEDKMGVIRNVEDNDVRLTLLSRVYIASPCRTSSPEQSATFQHYLELCMRDSLARKEAPYAPHAYLPKYLPDTNPLDRRLALDIGSKFLQVCNKLAVYKDHGITDGMVGEMDFAKSMKILIEIRSLY